MWRRALPVKQRVLLNLTNDRAINGILLRSIGDWLVLADAELLEGAGRPRVMDGEIYVERERVVFIQAAAPRGG
jgi:small nuclear ribonucleoprotein (snRNP)-like protein